MNRDRFEGHWKQLRGNVGERWGRLTGHQLRVAAGKRDQLAGRIQAKHGASVEEAERQLKDFFERNRNWHLSNR